MIDVTLATYEQDIIEASMATPVLVDFWSPNSSASKMLEPVLEKLDAEYAGRFILAKINIDESPQLAMMFGVRNAPTCILVKQGQAVDGFTGAQPEGQVRALLERHLGAAPAAPAEAEAAGEDEDDAALVQRLHRIVGQVRVLVVQTALDEGLLGFQLGDALGLGLARLPARRPRPLEVVQFRCRGTRHGLHPAPAFGLHRLGHRCQQIPRQRVQ